MALHADTANTSAERTAVVTEKSDAGLERAEDLSAGAPLSRPERLRERAGDFESASGDGRALAHEGEREDAGHGADAGAQQTAGEHVEREVHAQVDARERNRGGDAESPRPQLRAQDGDRRRRREGGGGMAGGERRVVGQGGERAEAGVDLWRPRAVEELLQLPDEQRGDRGGGTGGEERDGKATAPDVGREPEADQQRALDPPRREHDEHRGEDRVLEIPRELDQPQVHLGDEGHRTDGTTARRLRLVVNGHASGVEDPERLALDLAARAQELGASADATVTRDEHELRETLRGAAADGERVVLVGGDGSLHAAANAGLDELPELALVPAGRANNIARALGIPTASHAALETAVAAEARPLDALRVVTPERTVYAVEGVSAGFHAAARARYRAENSADLRQGLRALAGALLAFTPYRVRGRLDRTPIDLTDVAQLFLSNLPLFAYGFEVDPGADSADGRFEAVVFSAQRRGRLLRLLLAAHGGRHIGRRGVRRVSARTAEIAGALPLVADAEPLGTTTATVTVVPAHLRVAAPEGGSR
jgi:diacylglycerol kinase family enzyme